VLVLIGHGTFDGREAKFNLRSNDVAATELATGFNHSTVRSQSSTPLSAQRAVPAKLSGTNHVVVTATRSGSEVNYARFGQYFSTAVGTWKRTLTRRATSLPRRFLMRRGE